MEYDSLINTLYLSQRDIVKTFRYSQAVDDCYKKAIKLDDKLREKLASYPEILKIYDDLDNAQDEYVGAAESNAYYHGFKAGLQIAIECGLPTNT